MFDFLGDIWDGVSGLFGGGSSTGFESVTDVNDLLGGPGAGSIGGGGGGFQWKDWIVPGLTAATKLGELVPQAIQGNRQADLAAEQLAYERSQSEADRAFQIGKMLLDAQFKGGGGGGGGAPVPITTGIDVANVISANALPRQRAIEALMQGISSPLNRSTSGRI